MQEHGVANPSCLIACWLAVPEHHRTGSIQGDRQAQGLQECHVFLQRKKQFFIFSTLFPAAARTGDDGQTILLRGTMSYGGTMSYRSVHAVHALPV